MNLRKKLKLGATGLFPHGKVRPDDKGELRAAITADTEHQVVILDFGDEAVSWLSIDKAGAQTLAAMLIKAAEKLE